MEGFHPDWQGYLKPLIALVAPKSIQEYLFISINSFRPKTCLPCDKYLELKCLTYSELTNPISNNISPSRNVIKSSLTFSSSPSSFLGNRTGNCLGGIDILNANWMNKVRYETPALYIVCFDWQEYPISNNKNQTEDNDKINNDSEIIQRLENDALSVIKSMLSILKKRQSPPSVLIFVILPTGTPDPQSCVTCFRRNHFPELQAIFVTCGLKHQKHLNVRIERLAEMAYETSQAYYSENERRWRKSAIKAQTAGITASNDNFLNNISMRTSSSSGLRYSIANSVQTNLSPRFGRSSYFSISNSSSTSTSLLKNSNVPNNNLSRSNKNNSFTSSTSGNGSYNITQLQSKVLLIRYCIKSAVMNEFCGNFVLATKQYIAAWDNIINEINIPSYQFVIFCNIISIRLYHIYIINGEIQKAMNHLKIHCKTLREFGINYPKFSFLSSLWLSLTLQKLASILFFYIINREGEKLENENFKYSYPDGLEDSIIPLSVNKNTVTNFNLDSIENSGNNNLGVILSTIAKSIQNMVINSKSFDSEVTEDNDESSDVSSSNNNVIDILLNIAKLYKTSAEYSHQSRMFLLMMKSDFSKDFFKNFDEIGGQVLTPLSLGCFEELSSPEVFLEYETKDKKSKDFINELINLSSLYTGTEDMDINSITNKSILCEVLASCEITRRYIKNLLDSKSLFYRSITLFYISAVIYRHFYPINNNIKFQRASKNIINNNKDNNGNTDYKDFKNPVRNNENKNENSINSAQEPNFIGHNIINYMDRFFHMISISFAEYLFDENYINCSLSIYEAVLQCIIPKQIFSEINKLTLMNEQNKIFVKKRNITWEIASHQVINTCHQITSNYLGSQNWLFLRNICFKILQSLSIQYFNSEKIHLPNIIKSFLGKNSMLKFDENIGLNIRDNKQDDQYIYSVVSSFLTVLKSKRTWLQNNKLKSNYIHGSNIILSYIIICNIMEKSDSLLKHDINELHNWVQILYSKVVNSSLEETSNLNNCQDIQIKTRQECHDYNNISIKNNKNARNIILSQYLINTYSTLIYDVNSPTKINIILHHFPNYLALLLNSDTEINLITNIGNINIEIKNFEIKEHECKDFSNLEISFECSIEPIIYIQQNDDISGFNYREYQLQILIFGIFIYFSIGPNKNDYVKFAITALKYFNYRNCYVSSNLYKNTYEYSYIQYCMRNPPLSYFTFIGSWLRHSKTLIYNTPNLYIVPGGFLDIKSNAIANPSPLYKLPFEDIYILSKFIQPYNSLPIVHKLMTRNLDNINQIQNRTDDDIQRRISNIRKISKIWLLSPFNTLNVLLPNSKNKLDNIKTTLYNSVANEIKPLQLIIRIPEDLDDKFVIDISFNINRLNSLNNRFDMKLNQLENFDIYENNNSNNDFDNYSEDNVLLKFGYIKIPQEFDNNQWNITFNENILINNINNNSSSKNIGRFIINGKLFDCKKMKESNNNYSQMKLHIINSENRDQQIIFFDEKLVNQNQIKTNYLLSNSELNNITTPYFKVLKSSSNLLIQNNEFNKNDSIISPANNSIGILLLIPIFLSINKYGEYEISIKTRIININEQVEEKYNYSSNLNNMIIHELKLNRKWLVGECISIDSDIPKMDSLNGNVNYINKYGDQIEQKIVPILNKSYENMFYVSFDIINQQINTPIYIEKFILPKKFESIDDSFPKILSGNELNTFLINIKQEDFKKYYFSFNGQSTNKEIFSNSEYHPKIVVSLIYNLSCESNICYDNKFLHFILYPLQFILSSEIQIYNSSQIFFYSLPIQYNLFNYLYHTLILPSTRFYPITLETQVDHLNYIGAPFVYKAIIRNHTDIPQPIKYSLMYPPNINSTQDYSNLPTWLPLLIQGITTNNLLLSPNSSRTIQWICIPTQAGTIPLPCIYIQSDRSNKQFLDINQARNSNPKFSPSQLPSIIYTSEKRIVIMPRT